MTQHVIWRIENGELDGIDPRVVVLLIGTNNSATNTSEEIVSAIRKIVAEIQEKLPRAHLVLMAVFPRGPRINRDGTPDGWEQRMATIRRVNQELSTMSGGQISFLDISSRLVEADGRISESIMPDQLHLSAEGYQRWSDALKPILAGLMNRVPSQPAETTAR
jgi:lysophospholipase L1-like esterase